MGSMLQLAIILLKICANQLRLMDFGIIEKCNGAKMTPMAQMNSIRGCLWSGNRQTID